ncbi:MAG: hypothetical protein AAF430_01295 [Myxococcota bacterium]
MPSWAWIATLLFGLGLGVPGTAQAEFTVASFVASVFDTARGREIAYTLYYPEAFSGTAPVLLFSHGGTGSIDGHTRLGHFGTGWAAGGYVAIHLNHLPSAPGVPHRVDRPLDVSFVLDALQDGSLHLPAEFGGELALDTFGHGGHSFGAYTSMALAGGVYPPFGSLRDPRVVAIAPVSPQGADQFGAFDDGPADNTWAGIELPVFSFVGGDEMDTNAIGTIQQEGWRRVPFDRFPSFDDKLLAVLPGNDHGEMGNQGDAVTQAYLATQTRRFFDVYLRGHTSQACALGSDPVFPDQQLEAKSDPLAGLVVLCPPPLGLPEPRSQWALLLGAGLVAMLRRRRVARRQSGPSR